MLKNRRVVYILIPVNLLIWCFFIYRFYMAFHETDELASDKVTEVLKTTQLHDSVIYHLSLDYKDPFLKQVDKGSGITSAESRSNIRQQAASPVLQQVKTSVVAPLPDIKYLGLIRNSSSGLTKALVSINGQSRLIQEKDIIDGVFFKSLSRDSLVAKYGKDKIVARK